MANLQNFWAFWYSAGPSATPPVNYKQRYRARLTVSGQIQIQLFVTYNRRALSQSCPLPHPETRIRLRRYIVPSKTSHVHMLCKNNQASLVATLTGGGGGAVRNMLEY